MIGVVNKAPPALQRGRGRPPVLGPTWSKTPSGWLASERRVRAEPVVCRPASSRTLAWPIFRRISTTHASTWPWTERRGDRRPSAMPSTPRLLLLVDLVTDGAGLGVAATVVSA